MHSLEGVTPLANQFQFFLVDIWGVIFDGHALYPGAVEALQRLKAAGKTVLVSNAELEVAQLAALLQRHGVPPTLYDSLVTSGSVAKEWLSLKGKTLGERYLLLSANPTSAFYHLPDLKRTELIEEAQFVIVDNYPKDIPSQQEAMHLLKRAQQTGLPLVCANPDIDIPQPTGPRTLEAGALANAFETMGGQVIYFGKPHAPIYEVALAHLGFPAKESVCAMGDGLLTDIKGANAQSFYSVWVVQNTSQRDEKTLHSLKAHCERQRVSPHAVLFCFGP